MPGAPSRKTERLEARVTRDQKRTIARAAQMRGVSFTDFVIMTTHQAATEILKDAQMLYLRGEAQESFVAALLHPPEPNRAARAAARRYKERVK